MVFDRQYAYTGVLPPIKSDQHTNIVTIATATTNRIQPTHKYCYHSYCCHQSNPANTQVLLPIESSQPTHSVTNRIQPTNKYCYQLNPANTHILSTIEHSQKHTYCCQLNTAKDTYYHQSSSIDNKYCHHNLASWPIYARALPLPLIGCLWRRAMYIACWTSVTTEVNQHIRTLITPTQPKRCSTYHQ
jgi:hypothetical protein